MQRQSVQSSDLRSIGYDPGNSVLEIEFNSGGVYQYFNVPISVYRALMSASSHGTYFHAHIKGRYGDTKVR